MLDGLQSINWALLKHAYGAATDVPTLIRRLQGGNAEEREDARWHLYGNIFHQGTRYQATPHAVPFLVELLADPSTQERDELIVLLVALAVGYHEAFLPKGLNAERFRAALLSNEEAMAAKDRKVCEKYGLSPLADIATYDAVKKATPLFLSSLNDLDENVACAATYALAWFPEVGQESLPQLSTLISNARSHRATAHALLAAGLISQNSALSIDRGKVDGLLTSSSLSVSTAAALAACAVRTASTPYETLISALGRREEIKNEDCDLLFNDGDLIGMVALALTDAPTEVIGDVIVALRNALRTANPLQSPDVAQTLLDLVSHGIDDPATHYGSRRFSELSSTQQDALRTLRDFGGWSVGNTAFANFSNLMSTYGLPASRENFSKYIGD